VDFDPAPGGFLEEPQIADQLSTRHRYRGVVEIPTAARRAPVPPSPRDAVESAWPVLQGLLCDNKRGNMLS
jgi:hypothetical protein